ncbi:ATP phosphoribosyltransferase regulatory subunit [uncultured Ottowia sp.]|uniref:ATP phosphoribosyltransferase regulatory subunit n=1 Tax=uncultured Ottowia sp. TaxID=543067 RepID=UPI002592C067|nr:ATP phosphoribosyltransferase regulatory subunit [uncultured Ottowia sp.]
MSAWLLPDHIADALPAEARHIEDLRRQLLDAACAYGYELVMPPLVEYLDSLLTGTGSALELQTFKLVDQLSGKTLGVRADTTPQVARIDSHLLGREGVARLCYCGPVLHTRPERALASREPLQMGAEIYGYAGREADLEILLLALDCLRATGLAAQGPLTVDLADARIPRALLAGLPLEAGALGEVLAALAAKDESRLDALTRDFPSDTRQRLLALPGLYGDENMLVRAERTLGTAPLLRQALKDLRWLAARLGPDVRVSFDLADARGYAYYSGMRFAVYAGSPACEDDAQALSSAEQARRQARGADAVLRGGRYDGVGAVFNPYVERERPAVGFSLDVRHLARATAPRARRAAIRAPWATPAEAPQLAAAIAALRARGETVISDLPGTECQPDEFACELQLVEIAGEWIVQHT